MMIGLIAPYAELAGVASEVRDGMGLDFPIAVGILEGAMGVADTLIRQGSEVIISRGGTAAMLRSKLELPIVEIKVTGYDVMRALHPYIGKNRKIAIVGYQNVVHGCRIFGELFGLSIRELMIPSEEFDKDWDAAQQEVRRMVVDNDIDVVIGDSLVKGRLRVDNIEIQMVESGKEAIIQAVEEARHIARVRENERRAYERLRTIIHSVHDGVVATDEQGRITAVNLVAEEIFGFKEKDVLGTPIGQAIPNTRIDKVLQTGIAELEQLQQTPKGYIVTNRVPINMEGQVQGVVATFQEVAKIQSVEQKIRQTLFNSGLFARYHFDDVLTEDPHLKRIINIAKNYARTDATMLLLGESGTGKELFAQSIHNFSSRQREAFVAVNCSALPGPLLESELFGYVGGAFTGARKEGKRGLFELAHNGTIFLDEIGDMDKELQSRLLRVLEEKKVRRIGSDSLIPVNVRVIAATNMDIWNEGVKGKIRLDLYYRLNVLNITLPPLRERRNDISLLSSWLLKRYCDQYDKKIECLPMDVMEHLQEHPWIGNIRELKNVMERIVLSSENGRIDPEMVDLMLDKPAIVINPDKSQERNNILTGTMDEIKHKVATAVLAQEGSNIARAARRLEIDRNTLKKMTRRQK
ncbi:MAG: sigma 54-interacting transcriptional regulator [Negativicutes bacterium]